MLERNLKIWTARRPAGALVLLGLVALAAVAASGEPRAESHSWNVSRLAHHWFVPVLSVADVWLDSDHAYVARQRFGLGIVDVSDQARPRLVGTFNPGPGDLVVNDVKVEGGYAYLSNEGGRLPLYILDVKDPANPVFAGGIPEGELNLVHNLEVVGKIAYVVGNSHAGWRTHIYDMSDPRSPALLATLGNLGAHDVTVVGDLLYEAGGWSGLHIWDVADPAAPRLLASADRNQGPRPHYHTHNAWPSDDGRHVFTTNEVASDSPGEIRAGGLKVWEWDGGSELNLIAEWRPDLALADSLITIHNVTVSGSWAFVSYYQAGLRVLDISDPQQPVEVGFFDTYTVRPRELFQGCWGVFPVDQELVFVSDRLTGLHVLRFNGARRAAIGGEIVSAESGRPIPGALVVDRSADRRIVASDGTFNLLTGSGSHLLEVSAPGFTRASLAVELEPNALEHLRVALVPAGGDGPATPWMTDTGEPEAPRARLLGNHPNPFNPETTITLEVASGGGPVRVDIFDLSGRRICNLVDGWLSSGHHDLHWHGNDAADRAVAQGVYFARLETAGQAMSHRMLLVK